MERLERNWAIGVDETDLIKVRGLSEAIADVLDE